MYLERAIQIYEYVTPSILRSNCNDTIKVRSVSELIKQFDVLFLDGFGVLNSGKSAIPGAQQFLKFAKQMGVEVFVVTNAGSKSSCAISNNYRDMDRAFDSALSYYFKSDVSHTAFIGHTSRFKKSWGN